MKASVSTASAILGLSLAVWMYFYTANPGAPLTPPETVVVVGACGAAVLFARWAWTRLRKTRDDHETRS